MTNSPDLFPGSNLITDERGQAWDYVA